MSIFVVIFSNFVLYKRLGIFIWGILFVGNILLEILFKSWEKFILVVFWLLFLVGESSWNYFLEIYE